MGFSLARSIDIKIQRFLIKFMLYVSSLEKQNMKKKKTNTSAIKAKPFVSPTTLFSRFSRISPCSINLLNINVVELFPVRLFTIPLRLSQFSMSSEPHRIGNRTLGPWPWPRTHLSRLACASVANVFPNARVTPTLPTVPATVWHNIPNPERLFPISGGYVWKNTCVHNFSVVPIANQQATKYAGREAGRQSKHPNVAAMGRGKHRRDTSFHLFSRRYVIDVFLYRTSRATHHGNASATRNSDAFHTEHHNTKRTLKRQTQRISLYHYTRHAHAHAHRKEHTTETPKSVDWVATWIRYSRIHTCIAHTLPPAYNLKGENGGRQGAS